MLDYLRAHPDGAAQYNALKKELATKYPNDRGNYISGKTGFLLGVLRSAGLGADQLAAIEHVNRCLD